LSLQNDKNTNKGKNTNMITLEAKSANAAGTSLQGYFVATRSKIESVFGLPTYDTQSVETKVTTEWVIDFDGVIATIYDWKRYEMGKPEMDDEIIWNIGGKSVEATEKISEALGVNTYGSYPFHLQINL
jgi:hypothetical protein